MERNKKRIRDQAIAAIVTLGANLLLFYTRFVTNRYDDVSLDQILYQNQTSISGTNSDFAATAVIQVGGYGVLLTLVYIVAYLLLSGRGGKQLEQWKRYLQYCHSKVCRFFSRRVVSLSLALLLVSVLMFSSQLKVFSYVGNTVTESDFIEQNYADPDVVTLTFPEEKRNLIYIYLESIENTFADAGICDKVTDDYIPELTRLAEENTSFGGAYSYSGTTWTAAALVTQTSGVPIKVSLTEEKYGSDDYMPGITNLGDILEAQGYEQVLLFGSNAEFANRDAYFSQHGNYEILDTKSLKAAGRLPEDYEQWWGFEDEKLFAYAKEELTRLGQGDQPFNFTMLTADSHFPDGYVCRLCGDTYQEQYANVLRCSSQQIHEFITWIQQQPFYENTTVVISGDHLTMDPNFLADLDENYVRTVYSCIINAPVTTQTEEREFGTFDMFPTTLAALGVQIEGDRLGLGTNLFSGEQTLTEKYGYELLDGELQKNSEFYNTKFFEEAESQECTD